MRLEERDDAQLVTEARIGSREAAGELFSRHWRAAWRTAYAITGSTVAAEDVVQDSFERAFKALPRFDGRRPATTICTSSSVKANRLHFLNLVAGRGPAHKVRTRLAPRHRN